MDVQNDEIVASLNIYGYEGTLADNTGKPLDQSLWSLKSALPPSASVEDHVSSILKKIEPCKDEVLKVAKEYKTILSIGATYYHYNPEFVFEPSVLKQIGELNIQLWLDIYSFDPDKDDQPKVT